ncbi:MAG: STAS domain-containing protein [Acidobacteriia bacterium]|nr:STAS domain-containing protein [Terriglobia bacterium]
MLLEINEETTGTGIVLLKLKGRLTLGREVQRLEDHINELKKNGTAKVVFDLGGVDFVDSAGLGMLTQCFANVNNAGGQFYLSSITDRVKQVLKFTRLDTILPIAANTEEACALIEGKSAAGA